MDFEAVIGLETHIQMSTKTKMFCRCDNDSFDKAPNLNVCPVCMGFPGQLPVLNHVAVFKAVRMALALNCTISNFSKFDRKNYFYPDNPKGYQISQFDQPLSVNGFVDFEFIDGNDSKKNIRVGITRLHLEDDAGKLTHVASGSLIDFNRAGTPLMEIVSEPDIRCAPEAVAYAKELQKIVRYVGASDADMEKGMMRFDASVSVRKKGETVLNPRAEIKNLNSFKALESAVSYEIERQIKLFTAGNSLKSPITLGWNTDSQETFFMREKEESDDYRYFPEPDLPPLLFSDEEIVNYKEEIPELPEVKRKKYISEFGLKDDDARILSSSFDLSAYFERVVDLSGDIDLSVSFINSVLMNRLNEDFISVSDQKITPELLSKLIALVKDGSISFSVAKNVVFDEMYSTGIDPEKIVLNKNLKQVNDEGLIEKLCLEVIEANPDSVNAIKNGKDRAIGFLVGLVMKESKGTANPQMVSDTIKRILGS